MARILWGALWPPIALGVLLFWPAGTLAWPRAWIYLVVLEIAYFLAIRNIFWRNRDFLAERFKPPVQRGQPRSDRLVTIAFGLSHPLVTVLIPLDVFRYHWLPAPPLPVSTLGLALLSAGLWAIYQALRSNEFAAPVVRLQSERGQVLVDQGVYGVVRHPFYAGAGLMFLGTPLWLESWIGFLAAGLPLWLLWLRIGVEERFLREHLAGYPEYCRRVPCRLVPGLL